ncbi:MAG TPA: acetyl-CoA hydrolase/transferase C-terminal domain-containing protein [Opitutaceae bacterium]
MSPLLPAQWESWIRPGSRVFVGGGSACPRALMRSMCASASRLRGIELVHGLIAGECPWLAPGLSDTFTVNLLFSEAGGPAGDIDRTPCFASEVPGLFLEGFLPLDVAVVQVSPPDAHGYCSLGTGVDLASSACRAARTVIAQVNPLLPRTHGASFIHRDIIHACIEATESLPEFESADNDAASTTIGKYVAHLIPDAATLHIGFGSIIDAILAALGGHKDLGIHTEILTDGFLPLLESGVINNRAKTLHAGKSVAAACIGSKRIYDFVNDNPHVEFHPTEYVNSPSVISRNDRMASINSADSVDLSGQVTAEGAGRGFIGSIGGHADFYRGTSMSKDGVPIIALRSVTRDGKRSRISPALPPGSGVATSRGHVHYIVTEYGVATLRGRSIRERALELIQVAHPDFRDDLLQDAVENGWIPSYQRAAPRPVGDLGEIEVRRLELKQEPFILRPLHASDMRRLQEFFYSHTHETIQMRYGYAVSRMTRERAYDLVNVN